MDGIRLWNSPSHMTRSDGELGIGGGEGFAIACESGSQDHMECFWQNSIFKHLAGILMEPVCNFRTATLRRGS